MASSPSNTNGTTLGAARWLRLAGDPWHAASMTITLILLLPMLGIVWIALSPDENIWPHLMRTALPRYLVNTLQLMALVAIGTSVVGAGSAWLVANYRFPGRNILAWGLLAPLAVPSFIAAYAYVELLEYAGPRADRAASGLRMGGCAQLLVSGNPLDGRRRSGYDVCVLPLHLSPRPRGVP